MALAPPKKMGRNIPPPRRYSRYAVSFFVGLFFVGGFIEVALAVNEGVGSRRSVLLDSTNPARVEKRRKKIDHLLHSNGAVSLESIEAEMEKLVRWNPQRAELWRDLGHLKMEHRHSPDLDGALLFYHRALSLRPHHAPWWYEFALLSNQRGDFVVAERALRKAISIEPNYFDAQVGLAYFMCRGGRKSVAYHWLEMLRKKSYYWPAANLSDSGYRRVVLHKDMDLLERMMVLCQSEKK